MRFRYFNLNLDNLVSHRVVLQQITNLQIRHTDWENRESPRRKKKRKQPCFFKKKNVIKRVI